MEILPAAPLQIRETHCAGVVLFGDRAFKFKKPVSLGFLDFSTPAARWRACQQELELNRRFAPDVYLGVADLTLPDGAHEPVLVMRRMPDGRRLSTLVRTGVDVSEDLRQVARTLAIAHARSPHSPEIDEHAGLDALTRRWDANLEQSRPFVPELFDADVFDEVDRLVQQFLDGRRALFDRRIRQGCAVDGHGDLLADDIFCLPDGPRLLDCLEFDPALRHVDRLDDAAFLSMDLEHLGAPRLGAAFLQWYAEFSGDPAPASLRHHYVAYRAFVRAKVTALRAAQGSLTSAAEPPELLDIAHRHLASGQVRLIVVGGLPGTGKTTLARAVGDALGAVVISSDRVRKELAGRDPRRPAAAAFGEGIYTSEHTRQVYDELLREARTLLGLGESVVLDGSWSAAAAREAARELGRQTYSAVTEVQCTAPAELVHQRLELRRANRALTGDLSDADDAVAARMAGRFAPWPQAQLVDTAEDLRLLAQQICRLRGRGRPSLLAEPEQGDPAEPGNLRAVAECQGHSQKP